MTIEYAEKHMTQIGIQIGIPQEIVSCPDVRHPKRLPIHHSLAKRGI